MSTFSVFAHCFVLSFSGLLILTWLHNRNNRRMCIDAVEPLFIASFAITREKNKAERLMRMKAIEQGNNKSNLMQIFITATLLFPQDSNHTPNNAFQ